MVGLITTILILLGAAALAWCWVEVIVHEDSPD